MRSRKELIGITVFGVIMLGWAIAGGNEVAFGLACVAVGTLIARWWLG